MSVPTKPVVPWPMMGLSEYQEDGESFEHVSASFGIVDFGNAADDTPRAQDSFVSQGSSERFLFKPHVSYAAPTTQSDEDTSAEGITPRAMTNLSVIGREQVLDYVPLIDFTPVTRAAGEPPRNNSRSQLTEDVLPGIDEATLPPFVADKAPSTSMDGLDNKMSNSMTLRLQTHVEAALQRSLSVKESFQDQVAPLNNTGSPTTVRNRRLWRQYSAAPSRSESNATSVSTGRRRSDISVPSDAWMRLKVETSETNGASGITETFSGRFEQYCNLAAEGSSSEIWSNLPVNATKVSSSSSPASGKYNDDSPHSILEAEPPCAPAQRRMVGRMGLALAVSGSQLQQGEWSSCGGWLKKNVAGEVFVPTQLQQIQADDLVKVRELGRGCFGSVWLAKWRGCEVALKELFVHVRSDGPQPEVFSEAEKLAALRHPCVITCYGIVAQAGSYGTVVEYVRHGSLRCALKQLQVQGLGSARVRAAIMLQAARGIEYLHSQFVVHFDLKCDNLLCDLRDLSRPIVKIGDMGLSKKKADQSFARVNMRGTLPWMAPELFPSVREAQGSSAIPDGCGPGEGNINEKVDVFSFGICLWEAWMLGKAPYHGVPLPEIFAGVMVGTLRPEIPKDCDPEWAALMTDCWRLEPHLRPSFSEISERLDLLVQRWTAEEEAAMFSDDASTITSAARGVSLSLMRYPSEIGDTGY